MGDRLLTLSEWAMMFVGVVVVAVILSVIDRDVVLWEEEQEGPRDA